MFVCRDLKKGENMQYKWLSLAMSDIHNGSDSDRKQNEGHYQKGK